MATGLSNQQAQKRLPVAALAIIGVLLAAGGAGFWYLEHQSKHVVPPKPVLTPEAKAYVKFLNLSDVEMKATESYANQTIVEITGKIANHGEQPLKSVSIHCVFYDPYGQVVLRERVEIVKSRLGGLQPGETKSFRLPFDSLPGSWNQGPPQLVIAEIRFG